MGLTAAFLAGVVLASALFLLRYVRLNLSLASVMLGLMLALHGPAYFYYTRTWGPETDFFEQILLAAPGVDVIGTLDTALGLTFLGLCVGILLADLLFGTAPSHHRRALRRWTASAIRLPTSMVARMRTFAFVGMVILLAFIGLDNQLANVYHYSVSGAGEFEKIGMRRELGGSNVYFYNLMVASAFPFLAFCLLVLARESRRNLWGPFLLFALLLVVAKAATLSKAPLAVLLLQLLMVEYMRRSLSITLLACIKLLALSTLLFIAASFVANPTLAGISEILDFLFYRIFMISNESLLEYFAAIPHALPHTWGMHFSWVVSLMHGEPQPANFWLVGEVHRGVSGSTTTAMFMADAWADFAWAGVVLVPVAVGFLLRSLDIALIVHRGKTVATVAGIALGHFGIFIALSTALQTAMVTGGLLFVLPLVALVSGSRLRRRQIRSDGTLVDGLKRAAP